MLKKLWGKVKFWLAVLTVLGAFAAGAYVGGKVVAAYRDFMDQRPVVKWFLGGRR